MLLGPIAGGFASKISNLGDSTSTESGTQLSWVELRMRSKESLETSSESSLDHLRSVKATSLRSHPGSQPRGPDLDVSLMRHCIDQIHPDPACHIRHIRCKFSKIEAHRPHRFVRCSSSVWLYHVVSMLEQHVFVPEDKKTLQAVSV